MKKLKKNVEKRTRSRFHSCHEEIDHRIEDRLKSDFRIETRSRSGRIRAAFFRLDQHDVEKVSNVFRVEIFFVRFDVGADNVDDSGHGFLAKVEFGNFS